MTRGRRTFWSGVLLGTTLSLGAGFAAPAAASLTVLTHPVRIEQVGTFGGNSGQRFLRGPVAIARDGNDGVLFVSNVGSGEIVVLDSAGGLIRRMGASAGLTQPYGLAVDDEGQLYVSEPGLGVIRVFSVSGELVNTLEIGPMRDPPVVPGRITRGRDGRIFVTDSDQGELLILSPDGEIVASVPGLDSAQKASELPDGGWLVTCAQGSGVRIFDASGEQKLAFGEHGDERPDRVSFPAGHAVDARGRIWIADAFQHNIKVFDPDGTVLMSFGQLDDGKGGWGFLLPTDLCFGPDGMLYVLEKGADRIQVFQVEDLREAGND